MTINSFKDNNTLSNRFTSQCGKYIYHVSVIDYMQVYDWNKLIERYFKTFIMQFSIQQINDRESLFFDESKYGSEHLSSIDSLSYSSRFL